jgi:hypothetical protein
MGCGKGSRKRRCLVKGSSLRSSEKREKGTLIFQSGSGASGTKKQHHLAWPVAFDPSSMSDAALQLGQLASRLTRFRDGLGARQGPDAKNICILTGFIQQAPSAVNPEPTPESAPVMSWHYTQLQSQKAMG